jgi:hypothetical protein
MRLGVTTLRGSNPRSSAPDQGFSGEVVFGRPLYLGLLADRVAQTYVLAIGAATIFECCRERASQPAAPPRVQHTGCGLLGPDITAGQPGRPSTIEGLAGLASGAAVQPVRERRAGTMTASTRIGPRLESRSPLRVGQAAP